VPDEAKPDEAEVRALMAVASGTRKRPSRGLWIVALVVSAICVGLFAYGIVKHWDEPPEEITLERKPPRQSGSGFGIGLVIGVAAGIAIGSVLAMRRRQS
jgi:hypothetical protein